MTKRRLINKRAYDELVLLTDFCDKQEKQLHGKVRFQIGLDLDDEKNERFFIAVVDFAGNVEEILYGKDYTNIVKILMEYLNEN